MYILNIYIITLLETDCELCLKCDYYSGKDKTDELTAKQVESFYENQAKDDDEQPGIEGVDLSSHLDLFYAILKQVSWSCPTYRLIQ